MSGSARNPPPGRRAILAGAFAAGALMGQAPPPPRSSGPARGALLLMGGGAMSRRVPPAAATLAGGPAARWVYIPTALRDEEIALARPPSFTHSPGVAVRVLHTRERGEADRDAFIAPLLTATAVFIEGGREWRLADAYLGTRTEQALHDLLARGGLIAGTSAGASIMGSFLVRASPMGNGLMVSPGHERGFGFITHCAIDQHVVRRHREGDLAEVVAAHPDILGIGLDEGAAAVVRAGLLTALDARMILITDGAAHVGRGYYPLPPGAHFNLETWRAIGNI
jgi:cyanophycinase